MQKLSIPDLIFFIVFISALAFTWVPHFLNISNRTFIRCMLIAIVLWAIAIPIMILGKLGMI